jgi:hypothetical protein
MGNDNTASGDSGDTANNMLSGDSGDKANDNIVSCYSDDMANNNSEW